MIRTVYIFLAMLFMLSRALSASDIIPLDELLDSVLAVKQIQEQSIDNMVIDAVFFERKLSGKGKVKEEKKYEKIIYLEKINDSLTQVDRYLACYKDGERLDDKKAEKEFAKKKEEKIKRKNRDLAFDMTIPMQPSHRKLYDIYYDSMSLQKIDNYDCLVVNAVAKEKTDSLIDCTYYFDKNSFHMVKVDFKPSKLVKKMMFKLNSLDMSLEYRPFNHEIWVPARFYIKGKGKAALFVGVHFESEEIYSNHKVNTTIDREINNLK